MNENTLETKICRACSIKKNVKLFGVNNKTSSGFNTRCKKCMLEGILIPKKEPQPKLKPVDRLSLNLAFITKEDYINTFKALKIIGYDLKSELSIHQQFCEKYGLKPLQRKPVGKTIYTKEELIDFL